MSVDLSREIAAFEKELPELSARLSRRWVVFLDQNLQGDFAQFSEAVDFAMERFPERDFLIREVDAERVELPFLLVVA